MENPCRSVVQIKLMCVVNVKENLLSLIRVLFHVSTMCNFRHTASTRNIHQGENCRLPLFFTTLFSFRAEAGVYSTLITPLGLSLLGI